MITRQQYKVEKKEVEKRIRRAKLVRNVATVGTGVFLFGYAGGIVDAATHQVKKGETLTKIAGEYHVKVSDITKENHILNPDNIYVGQKLSIGNKTSTTVKQTVTKETTKPKKEQTTVKSGTYTVKAGDTLSAISKANGISVKEIQKLNNLTSDFIKAGQKLNLNAKKVTVNPTISESKSGTVTQKPVVTKTNTHIVKKGDTLWSLSRTYGVSVEKLMTNNQLRTATLKIGQKIVINGKAALKQPETKKEVSDKLSATYTVRAGDGIIGLAKRFNTSVMAIRELNQLKTDALLIGQKLMIPTTTVESRYGKVNGLVDTTSIEIEFPGKEFIVLEIAYGSGDQYTKYEGKTQEIIYAEGKGDQRGALIVIR